MEKISMPDWIDKWVGIDLDGTVAELKNWTGVDGIGAPIPKMVDRVKRWRAAGLQVRVVTARVGVQQCHCDDIIKATKAIEQWCLKYFGEILPVTCSKDYGMIELWDDCAVAVERNTGRQLSYSCVELEPTGVIRAKVLSEVLMERERQVNQEGWTPVHDDDHVNHELAQAAACYAHPDDLVTKLGAPAWPWGQECDKRQTHDYRKRLIIAAALLVAELERLERKL